MRSKQGWLLACSVLAATPAWAQSAVSVSGLLDLGIFRGFDGVNQVGTVQRSNLAFSGYDTLGSGVKLVFRLSTRMELDTGESEGAGFKPLWHDESTVGLSGAWGTVRVGRAMTAMWANDWKFDPWANFNRIASPAWYLWHPLTPSDPFANNGSAEYGRIDRGIFYDSPTLAGVTLRVSGSPARGMQPGATGRPFSTVLEVERGALAAMAAFERNSRGDRDTFVAGKLGTDTFSVMAGWDDSRSFDGRARSRATTLSGSWKAGANTFKAGSGRQRLGDATHYFVSLGADHALSRRTVLYASAGHQRQQGATGHTSFGAGISHGF